MRKREIARLQVRLAELVDTKAEPDRADREVAKSCRWLDRAAKVYGMARVERELRSIDPDGNIWLDYWRRWRMNDRRHLVPLGLLGDAYQGRDCVAMQIALAPRVAA